MVYLCLWKGRSKEDSPELGSASKMFPGSFIFMQNVHTTFVWQDLGKELSSELSGNFKTLCVEMLLSPAEFDAKQINKAVKVGWFLEFNIPSMARGCGCPQVQWS